ncbi:MAG: hypothetical protein ACYDDT_12825, partial [Sulfuricella sp.]
NCNWSQTERLLGRRDRCAPLWGALGKTTFYECGSFTLKDREAVGAEKVLVTASTNKVVGDLNYAIRAELVKSGQIEAGKEFTSVDKDGKEHKLHLAAGDRIALYDNYKDKAAPGNSAQNSEIGTVVSPPKGKNGIEALTKPTEAWIKFDGDKDPRKIDISKADLRHGYALTTHKLQGATAERAIVFASAQTSREMAYVQASRAKEGTSFVVTRETVNKMANQAEAAGAKPSDKMVQWVLDIEAKRLEAGDKPALPKDLTENFAAARDYLNKHSDYTVNKGAQPEKQGENKILDDLKNVVKAMETSREKETTLGYRVKEPEALDRAVEAVKDADKGDKQVEATLEK